MVGDNHYILEGLSIKSKKGFTIIEVLLALILISLIAVMATQILGFNLNSTKAFSLYGRQQYTVQDAFSRLNTDIQAASQIICCDYISYSGNKYKTIKLYVSEKQGASDVITCIGQYKLEGSHLFYRKEESDAFQPVVEGLTDESVFMCFDQTLTVILVPEKTSTGRNAMNIDQPITAEYSLSNKMHYTE